MESLANDKIADWFDRNPNVAKLIIGKCVESARARIAARKARELTRQLHLKEIHFLEKWLIAEEEIRLFANYI